MLPVQLFLIHSPNADRAGWFFWVRDVQQEDFFSACVAYVVSFGLLL
jgi:hypothetical protein